MIGKDEYTEKIIKEGDRGSKLLAAMCAPTLKNSDMIEVLESGMGGLAVVRPHRGYVAVVHAASGNPRHRDLRKHVASLVDNLVAQAEEIGAQPVAFGNDVDAVSAEKSLVEIVGDSLVSASNRKKVSVINGELAVLSDRINPGAGANVSGVMVSLVKSSEGLPETFVVKGVRYAAFAPKGKAVFINNDGVGSKVEFYERAGEHEKGVVDFFEMNWTDAIKRGADAKVMAGVVETRGRIPFGRIEQHAERVAEKVGVVSIMQHERVGGRIIGYKPGVSAYRISGGAVSLIDEKALRNPINPSAGECLLAIRGHRPNPRSNGISSKRRIMRERFGDEWHKTPEGKIFMEFLAEPCTMLYPAFRDLYKKGLATSFYHLSGGAYDGKLARPLAKHDLFVRLKCMFEPDWRDLSLAAKTHPRDAYGQWPLGTDGFVTVKVENVFRAIEILARHGLESRTVGYLEKAGRDGTGVALTSYNGVDVYFSGK